LLEDAEDLNWLCDTGDLDETYPPAVAAAASLPKESDLEPTPVHAPYEYAYDAPETYVHNPMNHPSVESLSFLVDSPKEGGMEDMSTFLDEEEEHVAPFQESTVDLPMVESQHLMSFPDLDMGDEQAFVSALLDTSKESALSFSKWGSQNLAEMEEEEEGEGAL
jgi:hypothetical protein